MKPRFSFMLALGVSSLTFSASSALALQIGVSDTYTCSSNSECKRKCEERGGRWKRDRTGTTYGTCTLPPSISIPDRIELLQKQLDRLIRQKRLIDEKQTFEWPNVSAAGNEITMMELKPSECYGLGGELQYDAYCPSDVICSMEAIDPETAESEYFFQCIDELDGAN
jgi:putative hemolysin